MELSLSISDLHAKAVAGDADAMFSIGYRCSEGQGVPKNSSEAFRWYRKAAALGHLDAINNLAFCYYSGRGVAKDLDEAFKLFYKAAESGQIDAAFNVGCCYLFGQGVCVETCEAVRWFRKAAEAGDAEAMLKLGECYSRGVGVSKDDKAAVALFLRAAEGGCNNALPMLGMCYSKGHGVEQDMESAFRWYRKAAESGDAASMVMLAECYSHGRGVKKDNLESVKWLRRAVKKGDIESHFQLGMRVFKGDGVTKDQAEGLYLIRYAAVNGHLSAVRSVVEIAENGDAEAQYHLGWLYAVGKGVRSDAAMATRLFVKCMANRAFGKQIAEALADQEKGESEKARLGISSLEDLAAKLGVSPSWLAELAQHKDRYYKRIEIPKSKSGLRKLDAPSKKLKSVQRAILSKVLCAACPSKYATAYVERKGLKANLDPHVNNRYFLCLDVRDFFGSISFGQIFCLFVSLGCSTYVADSLARLCSFQEYLPQGAPTSPIISNLIMKPFDEIVSKLCNEKGVTFTRYADDMTFSSQQKNLKDLVPLIAQHLLSFGFKMNQKKTRLMGARGRCVVTGIVKNTTRPYFGVGKLKKRRMRAIMFAASKGVFKDSQYASIQAIEGWLSFLKSIDHEGYQQMADYWTRIREKNNACSSVDFHGERD